MADDVTTAGFIKAYEKPFVERAAVLSVQWSAAWAGVIDAILAVEQAHVDVVPKVDDETEAARAFIEHGGKPYEIFSIEKAFLGELVEPGECLAEFYAGEFLDVE